MRRRYLDVEWGQIHVAEAGSPDATTIVLLHQTPRSWDEFREVLGELAPSHHVVAVDTPGMGASSPHPDGPSIEAYAEAVLAVIDDLACDVLLVGHHTGGVIAVEVAAATPERVIGLVLSSTPWVDEDSRRRRAEHDPIDTAPIAADGSHLQSLWQQRAAHYPAERSDLLQRFMADALAAVDPSEGHHAVGRFHMEDRFGLVRCPILLVGHADDPFGMDGYRSLGRIMPDAASVIIEGGSIPLEATAEAFAAEILHFAQSLS